MREIKVWDTIKIISQLTPRQPIWTIAIVSKIEERPEWIQWRWWKFNYILDIGGYYLIDDIELLTK